MRRPRRGSALILVLAWIVVLVSLIVSQWAPVRDAEHAALRRQESRRIEAALRYAMAEEAARLRRLASQRALEFAVEGRRVSVPFAPTLSVEVRSSPVPHAAPRRTVAREEATGRPQRAVIEEIDLVSAAPEALEGLARDVVAATDSENTEVAALVATLIASSDASDADALRAALIADHDATIAAALDATPRLARTNGHPLRRHYDRTRDDLPPRSLRAGIPRVVRLEARAGRRTISGRWAWLAREAITTQERLHAPTVAQPHGVEIAPRWRVGPEVEVDRRWELATSTSTIEHPFGDVEWVVTPGAIVGAATESSDSHHAVRRTHEGLVGVSIQDPAEALDFAHERDPTGPHVLDGGAFDRTTWSRETGELLARSGDSLLPIGIARPTAGSQPLVSFDRSGVWEVSPDEVRWRSWSPVGAKHRELALDLRLSPAPDPRPASLRALTASTLVARTASGELLDSHGTVNSGGSVLRGNDLSDLVSDGVYSSPLRRETLRYETSSLDDESLGLSPIAGSGSIAVKPRRSAGEATAGERVFLRWTQAIRVDFRPTVEWVRTSRPALAAAEIVTVARIGARTRDGHAISELGRRPAAAEWFHRRRFGWLGRAWRVRVQLADGGVEEWEVTPPPPGAVPVGEARAPDVGSGAEWQRLEWGWRDGGACFLAGRAGGSWSHVPSGGAPTDGVFTFDRFENRLAIGGDLGARVFDGTIADLRLSAAPPAESAPSTIFPAPSVAHGAPDLRWVLPALPSGAWLHHVSLLGEFDRAPLWRITTDDGSRVSPGRVAPPFDAPLRSDGSVTLEVWIPYEAEASVSPLVEAIEVEWLRPFDLGEIDVDLGIGPPRRARVQAAGE